MGVVFTKTPKGLAEMTNRSGELSPRMRRVLILVDGRRTIEDLRDLVAADDLTHTLGALEELALIELKGIRDADGDEQAAPDGPLPSITAFRELPPTPDPHDLEKARHFMINTLKSFCSLYGPISLMSQINSATTHEELRAHFPGWYHMIVDSRSGRRRAE